MCVQAFLGFSVKQSTFHMDLDRSDRAKINENPGMFILENVSV